MKSRLRVLSIILLFFVVLSGSAALISFLLVIHKNPTEIAVIPSKVLGSETKKEKIVVTPTASASSSAIPLLPNGISPNPYGISISGVLDDSLIRTYSHSGAGWIREKILWTSIETAPDVYDWAALDDHIAAINASGMHMIFVIYNAPVWHMITCDADHKQFAFGADDIAQFGAILSKRYNGKNGHGFIDGYEIGGGEFDTYWNGDKPSSESCRKGSYYAPVLKKAYDVIKGNSPKALIGMGALSWQSKQHEHDFLEELFSSDPTIEKYFDYGAVTYENTMSETEGDPTKPIANNLDYPTFQDRWSIMHDVFTEHKVTDKGIWISSIGWKDSFIPVDTQTKYLTTILSQAQNSRMIHKVFLEGTPTGTIPKIFESYKQYILDHPTW